MQKNHPLGQSIAVSAVLMALLFLLPTTAAVPLRAEEPAQKPAAQEQKKPEPVQAGMDADAKLRVLFGETAEEMPLNEYLTGVLRAEMPASFEEEALKAQAVAARTYTYYALQNGGKHENADICTEAACCQAYAAEEAASAGWGAAEQCEEKIRRAVQSTDGQVVLYGGEPIQAVFHAASSGTTRAAGMVWANDVPYLQPVSSPEDGDSIPYYYSREVFSAEEFRSRIAAVVPEAVVAGGMETWLTKAQRDASGSVVRVEVGGVPVKGSVLRGALGLRSACFTWDVKEERIVFFVTGYGHGVGLSQHGANQMAKEGATWQEILTHYYTGVSIDDPPQD